MARERNKDEDGGSMVPMKRNMREQSQFGKPCSFDPELFCSAWNGKWQRVFGGGICSTEPSKKRSQLHALKSHKWLVSDTIQTQLRVTVLVYKYRPRRF